MKEIPDKLKKYDFVLRLEARIKSEVNRNNQFKSILEELRDNKHENSSSKCNYMIAEIKYQMSNEKLYELNMILDNIIDDL